MQHVVVDESAVQFTSKAQLHLSRHALVLLGASHNGSVSDAGVEGAHHGDFTFFQINLDRTRVLRVVAFVGNADAVPFVVTNQGVLANVVDAVGFVNLVAAIPGEDVTKTFRIIVTERSDGIRGTHLKSNNLFTAATFLTSLASRNDAKDQESGQYDLLQRKQHDGDEDEDGSGLILMVSQRELLAAKFMSA